VGAADRSPVLRRSMVAEMALGDEHPRSARALPSCRSATTTDSTTPANTTSAYCAAGFLSRNIEIRQMIFAKASREKRTRVPQLVAARRPR